MTSRRSLLRRTAGAVVGAATVAQGAAGAPSLPEEYTIESNLKQPSGVSAEALDKAAAALEPGSPLVGLAGRCVEIEGERNINAIYQLAHAAHESAWGCSEIARDKNNLFGWNARDSCPAECADTYDSYAECVEVVMADIDELYLTEGGEFYNGPYLDAMNINYATDPYWAEKIATIMNRLRKQLASGAPRGITRPAFEVGETVKATDPAPVRVVGRRAVDEPSERGGSEQAAGEYVIATVPDGARGTLKRVHENEFDEMIWWRVEWEGGQLGWVPQQYLTTPKQVRSTNLVNVRTSAEVTDSNTVFTQPTGVKGTIANGPYENDSDPFTWWWVEWENGFGGWSPAKFIGVIDEQPADPGYVIGQEVAASTCLAVRKQGGWNAQLEGVVDEGDTGYVKNGYLTRNDRRWWDVAFSDGPRGWVQGEMLDPVNPGVTEPRGADRLDGMTWPVSGDVTSEWGEDRGDYIHYAVDIGAPTGRPSRAPASGVVVDITYDGPGGKSVYIDHGARQVSQHHHFSKIETSVGAVVEQGEVIAEIGNTGASTGPHLHFELYRAEPDGGIDEHIFLPLLEGDQVEQGDPIPYGQPSRDGRDAE